MATLKITINDDIRWSKCGKRGAVAQNPSGLCLECIRKIVLKKYAKESG